MTIFNVYDHDGRITQSNKVYDPTGYADALLDHGYKFVEHDGPCPINMDKFHVKGGALRDRPQIGAAVSKTEIRAGGSDVSVFTGVPTGALVTIRTGGMTIASKIIPGRSFELPIPVPCVYSVTIEKWPFQPFTCDVRAVA